MVYNPIPPVPTKFRKFRSQTSSQDHRNPARLLLQVVGLQVITELRLEMSNVDTLMCGGPCETPVIIVVNGEK